MPEDHWPLACVSCGVKEGGWAVLWAWPIAQLWRPFLASVQWPFGQDPEEVSYCLAWLFELTFCILKEEVFSFSI